MDAPRFVNGFVDGRDLFLVYRDPAGRRMARRVPAEWSCFLRRQDVPPELLRELKTSEFVAGVREEGDFLRVLWSSPEWRRRVHDRDGFFAERGIQAYESDVEPVRRYFSDTGAAVGIPSRVYLDIETDSRVPPVVARQGKARVLCWSLAVKPEGAPPRTLARCVLDADTDDAERVLLERMWEALEPYDQVVAWFGDLFDFPVVKIRSQKVGAKSKDPRRWLWMDHAELWERMNSVAAESGGEKSSRALNFVAQETIGEGKHEFDARQTWVEWEAGGERRERMALYCDQDALLLPKLEERTGYLALNDSVCEVSRVFADTASVVPTTFVDGFMLRLGVERGIRFADPHRYGEHQKFRGGFVLEPQVSGIRKNVHVVDFSGMYPSIIQTLNISPETIANECPVNGPIPSNVARAPLTRVGFRQDVTGLFSFAVAEMKRHRKYWSDEQKKYPPGTPEWAACKRRSDAYKRIVNIFYGMLGNPHCFYFERSVAESVSTTGVWLIEKTIEEALKFAIRATYGDTDSAFFESSDASPLTHARMEEFVRHCNVELYPRILREIGCRENFVELAYEKSFERLSIVTKKRYWGNYSAYKGTATCTCDTPKGEPGAVDVRTMTCRACGKVWESLPPSRGKPEIRGLEYRRGDVLKLAREMQREVIEKFIRERSEDPADFVPIVERWRKKIFEEPLSVDDVSFSQSLTKSLREYEKARKEKKDGTLAAEPAHVQVARILRSRGEQVVEGMRVAYVVTDGSCSPMKVIPAVDYKGECDRFSLWEDDVYPATMRVLQAAFPVRPGMAGDDLRALDWERFHKVRPRRERGGGKGELPAPDGRAGTSGGKTRHKAAAGQESLFALAPPPAAAARPTGPAEFDVGDGSRLVAVREALRAHPGDREVVLRLADGRALGSSQRVADSPELRRAVDRALRAASLPDDGAQVEERTSGG